MSKPLAELRERLLRAGIAPRHVRRYITELEEHVADLTAEEERAGQSGEAARAAAFGRLGSVDELAQRMIAKREFRSVAARAPWAVLGLGPLLCLTGAWALSLTILVTGWAMFLPQARTPFVGQLHGVAIAWFGMGRELYFTAPVLIGWGAAIVAARQRLRVAWAVVGWALLAWCAATAQVHAERIAQMSSGTPVWMVFGGASTANLTHALVVFLLIVTPYVVWRWREAGLRS